MPELKKLAENAMPEARAHAVWLLEALNALGADDVARAMKDSDARIRENAEVATELQALDYIPFVLGDSASILDAPHFAYVIAAHRLDRRGRFLAERVCRTARSLR